MTRWNEGNLHGDWDGEVGSFATAIKEPRRLSSLLLGSLSGGPLIKHVAAALRKSLENSSPSSPSDKASYPPTLQGPQNHSWTLKPWGVDRALAGPGWPS